MVRSHAKAFFSRGLGLGVLAFRGLLASVALGLEGFGDFSFGGFDDFGFGCFGFECQNGCGLGGLGF